MKFMPLNLKQRWNVIAVLVLLLGLYTTSQMIHYLGGQVDYHSPTLATTLQLSLDGKQLLVYLSYTLIRMFLALCISLILSLSVGKIMATYPRLAAFLLPVIDILQSIPVMGFLTLVTGTCLRVLPHSLWGAQLAVIFAMVTCQLWNMLLSVYQSITRIPAKLRQVQHMLNLSHWSVFWHIELPFILPTLVWNAMLSMSATWFMIIAAENLVIPLGATYLSLDIPGIGGFINQANSQGNYQAVMAAVLTMLGTILIYDNLIFNPLLKYLAAQGTPQQRHDPNHLYGHLSSFFTQLTQTDVFLFLQKFSQQCWQASAPAWNFLARLLLAKITLGCGALVLCWKILPFLQTYVTSFSWQQLAYVTALGILTAARVMIVLIIGSLIVLPIGVTLHRRPRLKNILQPIVQLLASFPLNVFYGTFASFVLRYHLPFNVYCIIIMLAGTIWYLVFNILAASTTYFSSSLQEAIQMMQPKGWVLWTKFLLPAILPHYLTGLISASGAAWNASVLCEYIEWKNNVIAADGIGAYIAAHNGKIHEVMLGIAVMTGIIWLINKLVWVKLLKYTKTA